MQEITDVSINEINAPSTGVSKRFSILDKIIDGIMVKMEYKNVLL